jgi:hypothetical protein
MTITLRARHIKTSAIADWTQADLDAQIALGNYPTGTVLADIVLPTDWNDLHENTLDIYSAENVLGNYAVLDLLSGDKTLTTANVETFVGYLVLLNAGAASTITWAYPNDSLCNQHIIDTRFCAYPVTISFNSNTAVIPAGGVFDCYIFDLAVIEQYTTNNYQARIGTNGSSLISVSGDLTKVYIGRTVVCDTAGCTLTIKNAATEDMGENALIRVGYKGATGSLTIAAGAGVTLTGATSILPNDFAILQRDGTSDSWVCLTSSANVTKVGTPVNNQVGVWTGDGTLEGDAALTYDSGTDTLTSVNFAGALTGNATTVTTNANLTGQVTSVGNAATLDISGQGAVTVADGDLILFGDVSNSNALARTTALQVSNLGLNIGKANALINFMALQ